MFKYTSFKKQRVQQKLSEAELALRAGISRLTLRSIESGQGNPTWGSIDGYARELGFTAEVILVPQEGAIQSEDSIVGISLLILQNGFKTWATKLKLIY